MATVNDNIAETINPEEEVPVNDLPVNAVAEDMDQLNITNRNNSNGVIPANLVQPQNVLPGPGPSVGNTIQPQRANQPGYSWQATKTCIKDRVSFLYNNETLADIHFVVGTGAFVQRIPAHKLVLSVGSAVFYAMFNSTLATDAATIDIPDIEPPAFLALLKFLYSDEVQLGPENVINVLYTAKKYAVPALEKLCVDFLRQNLNADNAFMLLTQARLFDETDLAKLCLRMIDKNTSDALVADGFTDIDQETLCMVLRRSSLRVKETQLFQAVVRWAAAECARRELPVTPENQRVVLGPALRLIRFPLMSVEEFAVGAAQSKFLTDREVVSLFLYFIVNPKPSIDFIDTPRSGMAGNELSVNRFLQTEMRWGYSGSSDRVRFVVDHPIHVTGFGLYGGVRNPSDYNVLIEIHQTSTGNVLACNNTSFTSDGSAVVYRVLFAEPVQINANVNYTASATINGPDSYYGTKGQRRVHVDTEVGRVNFHFLYCAGNNNGTSIEDGQVPQILFHL